MVVNDPSRLKEARTFPRVLSETYERPVTANSYTRYVFCYQRVPLETVIDRKNWTFLADYANFHAHTRLNVSLTQSSNTNAERNVAKTFPEPGASDLCNVLCIICWSRTQKADHGPVFKRFGQQNLSINDKLQKLDPQFQSSSEIWPKILSWGVWPKNTFLIKKTAINVYIRARSRTRTPS